MSKIKINSHPFKAGYDDILRKEIKSTYITNIFVSIVAGGFIGSFIFIVLMLFGLLNGLIAWVVICLIIILFVGRIFLSTCNIYVRRLRKDLSKKIFELVEVESKNVYSGILSDGRSALAFDCCNAGTFFLAGGWWLPKYRKHVLWYGDDCRKLFPSHSMKIHRMPNSYLVVAVECSSQKHTIKETKLLALLQININCMEECFVVNHSFEEMAKAGLEVSQHKLEIS